MCSASDELISGYLVSFVDSEAVYSQFSWNIGSTGMFMSSSSCFICMLGAMKAE